MKKKPTDHADDSQTTNASDSKKQVGYKKFVTGDPELLSRRRQAGAWLCELRTAAGLTMRQMANGSHYFTFISQVENGHRALPMELWKSWAEVLKVDQRLFAERLLELYHPVVYQMITSDEF